MTSLKGPAATLGPMPDPTPQALPDPTSLVLVVNPSSLRTKVALARVTGSENSALPGQLGLELDPVELPEVPLSERLERDLDAIRALLRGWPTPDAVVSRAGHIGPLEGGTYEVGEALARAAEHSPTRDAINLGAPLALALASELNRPAYVVDPPTADELLPEARLTGVPGQQRRSFFHALNARAVARRAAHEAGKRLQDARVVVAHLGVTTSVTLFGEGRALDTTGAWLDEGPFSTTQAGGLPLRAVLALAETHGPAELRELLSERSGFFGLTGVSDLRELEARSGEPAVREAARAYAHQVAKSVGAYSAVAGRPDAIALTGGGAHWDELVTRIERRVAWIAPFFVFPGELELEALAEGAGRVLLGLEHAKRWPGPTEG